MKRHILAALCAAFAVGGGSAAFAADAVTAKLQTPVAERTKFIAGGAMFVCEGDSCVASAPSSQTFALATCRVIAGKAGAVASFTGRRAFDEARLADCNAKVQAAAVAAR